MHPALLIECFHIVVDAVKKSRNKHSNPCGMQNRERNIVESYLGQMSQVRAVLERFGLANASAKKRV